MKYFERFAPWIAICVALGMFALSRAWRQDAMDWEALAKKETANSSGWERASTNWEAVSMKWEREASNSIAMAHTAMAVCDVCQSNFTAHLKTHQPATNDTTWTLSTNDCGSAWNLADRSTWEFITEQSNDGGWDLYVYGELIGRIFNCKFIPFEK